MISPNEKNAQRILIRSGATFAIYKNLPDSVITVK